ELALPAVAACLAGGALGLGGGPPQRGANLLGRDLHDGALLALVGLPAPLPELPDDDHAVALAEGVGEVGGQVPPGGDPVEGGVAVAPGVAVADAAGDRDAEV